MKRIISIVLLSLFASFFQGLPYASAVTQNVNCGTSGYFVIIDNVVTNDGPTGSQCKGSVAIPNTATSIANSAFANNSFVTTLSIPGSVTTIGTSAFDGLTSLTSLTLGQGIVTIGNFAFRNNNALTTLSIPGSVTTIGNNAFESLDSLTSLTLQEGIVTIGDFAFYDETLDGITSLTIPNSVQSIGEKSFMIYVTSGAPYALTNVDLGTGLTTIGYSAFYNTLRGVARLVIPDSVTNLGDRAFRNSNSSGQMTLRSVVIGSGLQNFYNVFANQDLICAVVNRSNYTNAQLGIDMPNSCPGTPGRPTVVGGDSQAVVTVSQPATGTTPPTSGGVPTSYTVTASPGGATCTVSGSSGSCTITGLSNGTSYTFTSTATNATGTSASSTASLSTTPASAPPTLTSTSATSVEATTATLNFTSNKTGNYYYLVYAANDTAPSASVIAAQGDAIAKGTNSALASANSINVTGLSANTAYKAYVIVKDVDTNNSLVTTINLTTKPAAPSSPDLATGSDLGSSSTDNQTADDTPTIDLTGLTTGAVVTVTATPATGSPVTCSFTASSGSGGCIFSSLPNGTYAFKASQTINGVSSSDSANLNSVVIFKTNLIPTITLDL